MPGRDIRRPLVKYKVRPSGLTIAEVSNPDELIGAGRLTGALHPVERRLLL
jgi:hypothetical protein